MSACERNTLEATGWGICGPGGVMGGISAGRSGTGVSAGGRPGSGRLGGKPGSSGPGPGGGVTGGVSVGAVGGRPGSSGGGGSAGAPPAGLFIGIRDERRQGRAVCGGFSLSIRMASRRVRSPRAWAGPGARRTRAGAGQRPCMRAKRSWM